MKILLEIKKYLDMAQSLFKKVEPVVAAPKVEEQPKPAKKKNYKPKPKKAAK